MTHEQIIAALTIFEALRDHSRHLADLPGVSEEEREAIHKVASLALRKFQERYEP